MYTHYCSIMTIEVLLQIRPFRTSLINFKNGMHAALKYESSVHNCLSHLCICY